MRKLKIGALKHFSHWTTKMPVTPILAISPAPAVAVAATSVSRSSVAPAGAHGYAPKAAANAEVFQQFEALILKQFVEAMLPKDADNVYGGGFAGDAWKSMLADKIAAELAASGTLGIAKALFPEEAAAPKVTGVRDQASFRPSAPATPTPSASGASAAGLSEVGRSGSGLAASIPVNLAVKRSWS